MRSAVAGFLQEEMEMTVHMAVSYEEALSKIAEIGDYCDLALVDISLPRRNNSENARLPLGVKLVREIKQKRRECGVVLWSAYTHFLHELMELISEGFQGLAYVPKGSRIQVLQTAIERVMKGDVFLHRAVLGDSQINIEQTMLSSLDPETAKIVVNVAERFDKLSPRQIQVVERMTKTPAAIAEELNLEVRTVRNYQDVIYERLGLRDAWSGVQKLRRDPVITLALLLRRLRQSQGA